MSVVEASRSEWSELAAPPVGVLTAPALCRVALLGYGRVGQAVAALAHDESDRLRGEGLDLRIVGALVRDPRKPRNGPPQSLQTSHDALFAEPFDVLIDVMGGLDPAGDLVKRALDTGRHVVTANKTLVAARGLEFEALARQRGVSFVYDAAVLAGVPFLGALARRPLIAASSRISGIINGTSHFITCRLSRGGSLQAALDEATRQGYAEPDSSADLSGRDAAEKLTILLHLAGCRALKVSDLTTRHLDVLTSADVLGAHALGGAIKPAALAWLDPANPGAWVGPVVVDRAHPFAALDGVQNAIEFAGQAADPVTFAGPGAGPRVTAATILDDVVEAVAAGTPKAASNWRPEPVPAKALQTPPATSWYVRAGGDTTAAELRGLLADARVPIANVIECGRVAVARTNHAPWSAITAVIDVLRAKGREALALPVLERR